MGGLGSDEQPPNVSRMEAFKERIKQRHETAA